jgi:hypothetical protein
MVHNDFRQKMSNLQVEPSIKTWNRIDSRLSKKRPSFYTIYFKIGSIAAAFLITFGVSYLFLINNDYSAQFVNNNSYQASELEFYSIDKALELNKAYYYEVN